MTAIPAERPLALAVHRRDLTNLITWPPTGVAPARLADLRPQTARRGPAADGPALRAEEQTRFFDHLRVVADRYRGEGDRESLHEFVARGLVHDDQESANLNYWAYWLGEISETYADDRFMTAPAGRRWTGERVPDHLLNRLRPDSPHLALNVHTVWALMLARPRIVDGQGQLRTLAGKRVEHLMDSPALPTDTRKELAGIAYGIRLADG